MNANLGFPANGDQMERWLSVLKLAIGVVLLGGGAAWTAGGYAAKGVAQVTAERLDAHNGRLKTLEERVPKVERDAAKAAVMGEYNSEMLQMLLRDRGMRPPPKPKVAAKDGGE